MDFYVILGVGPDASAAEIKRAYRRLSRRYHPGVNPGDRAAEEVFRRIVEAYETLIDPGRRRQYDVSGGHTPLSRPPDGALQFTEFDFSSSASGSQAATFSELFADVLNPALAGHAREERGLDIHAAVTVDFLEALRGVERQIVVTRQVPCGQCRGSGQILTAETRCGQCQGTGGMRWTRGHMVFSKVCSGCSGSGRQRAQRCSACAGGGRTVRGEAVAVDVPPGTADGDQLQIADRGHAGRNGGRNGDLYVSVSVRPHPFFHRDGDDLVCEVPVAVHEAVLGARIEVPAVDGSVKLRIPPGTQGGHRFRLSGRGVPGPAGVHGDLIVEVKLVLPDTVDGRSRELMREFGDRNNVDVRRQLWTSRT
jgi:molecular chaperone DnaJ